jgi:large subunit ribosomal protein L24
MRRKFSFSWRKSKQKRKQIKFRANSPLHIKHKLMSANLSKELRKKYGKRSLPVRKNDAVLIMKGKFKKKKGKIMKVDLKRDYVYVEGIQKTKKDGSKINVPLKTSNLQIQELYLEDKKRIKIKPKQEQKKEGKENERK